MNRPALVPGLAGNVPDLGHVRHVAHAQPAIVEEGRHPVDLQVCNIADGRTQGELRRQVDGAAAHVGERPLPASFGKAQRPVVAQPVDGDLPDLGAAGEMALLVRAPPRPRDHDLGGSEIEIDPIDLRGVLHIVDAELRRHGMDLMGRRQDTRQGDAAVVAADVDGDVPDLSIAGPVDQKPPGQGDIDPAQDGQIRGKIGEDPGLEARDPGLQRDAAAITRVGAGKRQIDRVAMSLEAGIGGYEDADGVAPELRIGIWRRPRETCLQVPENDVRPLDQHRIELADQRFVIRLGEQLVDEDRHRRPLGAAFLRREDALEHSALARNVRFDLRSRDDDRRRQQHALYEGTRLEGQRRFGHGRDHLLLVIGETQAGESQPDGPAEAAPLEGNPVEVGMDIVARNVDQPGDAGFQESEVDRSGHEPEGRHDKQRGQRKHDTGRHTYN